ncbi:hypothetical protein ZHAS_00019730 [Anopheles sinensis]|uniref:Uncharacterized protein n=1 Tax=Anopheles sinensis TaxID=74873 RepID=A0A084WN56_ANOSI|nr:hypothetical protein ZHAS_00019730 [Anopheles sinensis]
MSSTAASLVLGVLHNSDIYTKRSASKAEAESAPPQGYATRFVHFVSVCGFRSTSAMGDEKGRPDRWSAHNCT